MPADHVLDASVAAKAVIREDGTDAVLAWLDSGRAGETVAPDFLAVELGSVMLKRRRTAIAGETITAGDADRVLMRIDRLVPTDTWRDDAFDLALRTGASFYDALYLLVAQREGAPLVTADQRLVERVRASGEPVDLLTIAELATP